MPRKTSPRPKAPRPRLKFKYVQARTLKENPHNWRLHPEAQVKALGELIEDPTIGWAGALLYNERTGRLVDGHARLKRVKPSDYVPVLVGDWDEPSEKKILATLDPIAGMATVDEAKLRELLDEVSFDTPAMAGLDEHLRSLLKGLDEEVDSEGAEDSEGSGSGSGSGKSDPEFMILITCKDERHQRHLCQRFIKEDLKHRTICPDP